LAIKDFNKAIEIHAENSEAYYRRGISKLASHAYHDAIHDLRKSESLEDGERESRNAGIPCGLGECYHQLKEYD